MKKTLVLFLSVFLLFGCSSKKEPIPGMIYVGTENTFETLELAEFQLTELGIPYVVMDAGTTSSKGKVATIDADFRFPKKGKTGYYANDDGTIVIKTYTYEPEEEAPKEETPKDTSSGYQEIYDKWAAEIKLKAPDVSMMELAEITNEGVAEMATYMYKAKGKDGQYETYEKWAGELMDLYMAEAR